jgi:hypothetical protein
VNPSERQSPPKGKSQKENMCTVIAYFYAKTEKLHELEKNPARLCSANPAGTWLH